MVQGIWGQKVGMTQIFAENNKVIPVTVVDVSGWFVLQVKTEANDGYNAIKVGKIRKRYKDMAFDAAWLKSLKTYFLHVREVKVASIDAMEVGAAVALQGALDANQMVDVVGTTIGRGFAGVMKRHGFSGGPASHGSTFHRRPGGISFLRTRGKVIKGKKLPGHMGDHRHTTMNLTVVEVRPQENIILVKGALSGKPGSLVFLRKRG